MKRIQKQLPKSLISELKKRGWRLDIYGALFLSCLTQKKLYGDDYSYASHLAEIGFMTVKKKPIWNNGSYHGNQVEFTSYIPI